MFVPGTTSVDADAPSTVCATPRGGHGRQDDEAILVAFAATHVDAAPFGVDVADLEMEGLAQAQTEAVGDEPEASEVEALAGQNQPSDLIVREDVGQTLRFRCLGEVDPGEFLAEDLLVEEPDAIAVDLDGGPGVRFEEVGEVPVDLLLGDVNEATIEGLGEPTDATSIGIDGARREPLEFQGPKVFVVELREAGLFAWLHVADLVAHATLRAPRSVRFTCSKPSEWGIRFVRSAAQRLRSTRQMHSDGKKRRSFLALLFSAGDLRRYTAFLGCTDTV